MLKGDCCSENSFHASLTIFVLVFWLHCDEIIYQRFYRNLYLIDWDFCFNGRPSLLVEMGTTLAVYPDRGSSYPTLLNNLGSVSSLLVS